MKWRLGCDEFLSYAEENVFLRMPAVTAFAGLLQRLEFGEYGDETVQSLVGNWRQGNGDETVFQAIAYLMTREQIIDEITGPSSGCMIDTQGTLDLLFHHARRHLTPRCLSKVCDDSRPFAGLLSACLPSCRDGSEGGDGRTERERARQGIVSASVAFREGSIGSLSTPT